MSAESHVTFRRIPPLDGKVQSTTQPFKGIENTCQVFIQIIYIQFNGYAKTFHIRRKK